MKNIILFLIFTIFFSLGASAQNYWVKTTSPTTHNLTKFVFTDVQNGWAVGDSGVIIHTSNGGLNWVVQNSPSSSSNFFRDIFFLNMRLGWCIVSYYSNDASTILKTTNGGINWFGAGSPDSTLASIYFIDSLTGFLGDWYQKIFKTTDGGATWFPAYLYPSQYNYPSRLTFRFYNPQYGLESGGFHEFSGLIFRTTDFGSSWKICDSAFSEPINDLCYLDSNNAIGCGGDFEFGITFMTSTDKGLSWKNVYLPFRGYGRAIAPRTRKEIWLAMGSADMWAASFDSARSWTTFPSPDSAAINYCKFIDPKHGWSVADNGIIYKFDTNMIGIEKKGSIIPVSFELYQNYPNPFNPSTKIKFSTPLNSPEGGTFVRLVIYDILGCKVAELVNEKLQAGSHEVEWDGTNYPSGVYLYKLSAGNFSQTKKMVLVK